MQPVIQKKMKTSKIIFVTLLISIAVFIIVAFIDIRLNGKHVRNNPYEIASHKEMVPPFKVFYAENSINIRIVQSDSSYIELAWNKDSIPPSINYKVKNDTLIITDVRLQIQNSGYQPVKIHSTSFLTSIISKDSEIAIESFGSGKMSVDLDNSSAWFSQNKSKIAYYSNLYIIAKNNSSANTNEFRADTLCITLQNSQSNLQILAKRIHGTLSDSSIISLHQPGEISLKIDSTSIMSIKR